MEKAYGSNMISRLDFMIAFKSDRSSVQGGYMLITPPHSYMKFS